MAGRVSQEPVEVAVFTTSESARVSQEPVEVAVFATSESSRISQLVIEVLFVEAGDVFPAPFVPVVQPVVPTPPVFSAALIYPQHLSVHLRTIMLGPPPGVEVIRN